jgi:hypothetical protein
MSTKNKSSGSKFESCASGCHSHTRDAAEVWRTEIQEIRKKRKEPTRRCEHELDKYLDEIAICVKTGKWSAQYVADLLWHRHRASFNCWVIYRYVKKIPGLENCFNPETKRRNRQNQVDTSAGDKE